MISIISKLLVTILVIIVFILPSGCANSVEEHEKATKSKRDENADSQSDESQQENLTKTITLTSSAFQNGEPIPQKHTCDADDLSPSLQWSSIPEGTKSIALICDDPDAPDGIWVHWVLYNLPADATELSEDVPKTGNLENGTLQGTNDFKKIGYGGPCPPPGSAHRYFFKIYALDTLLDLEAGATKQQLVTAMDGHIIAEGELMGTYQSQK